MPLHLAWSIPHPRQKHRVTVIWARGMVVHQKAFPLMQNTNKSDLSLDEPLCVCGYPKSGLHGMESPCPECGSTELATYASSFSYYGWNVALLGVGITVVHGLFLWISLDVGFQPPEILLAPPWVLVSMPLGVLSLLYALISKVRREPKRKLRRNVGMALLSVLLLPVVGFVAFLLYVASGGLWTV